MSEGFALGPYMLARVGFEPATLRTYGTELTTEPPCPAEWSLSLVGQSLVFAFLPVLDNLSSNFTILEV